MTIIHDSVLLLNIEFGNVLLASKRLLHLMINVAFIWLSFLAETYLLACLVDFFTNCDRYAR